MTDLPHSGLHDTPRQNTRSDGDAMPFARSDSVAQGYSVRPSAVEAPAREGMPFARSTSEPQAIVQAEKTQQKGGVVWRLKNAFLNGENAMSTWMTLGFIKAWTDKTMGAWGMSSPFSTLAAADTPLGALKDKLPSIPGAGKFNALAFGKDFDKSKLVSTGNRKPEGGWEKLMAMGVTGALIQNLAFFMTARGGEVPEGDTIGERVMNSLKNPDKHSVHFSNATMSGFIGLIGLSRVAMGVKGLRSGDADALKKNGMMLVSGLSALVSAPLVFTGLFQMDKKKQKTPSAEQEQQANQAQQARDEQAFSGMASAKKGGGGLIASLNPAHLKEMWQYALTHDRVGMLGRALAVTMELGFMMDGRMQLKKDPTSQSAYNTVKGGLTGLMLTCMQTHFVYDRLLNNSKKEAGVSR